MTVTESPYRVTSDIISSTCGIVSMHMPILDAVQTAARKAFERAFCS